MDTTTQQAPDIIVYDRHMRAIDPEDIPENWTDCQPGRVYVKEDELFDCWDRDGGELQFDFMAECREEACATTLAIMWNFIGCNVSEAELKKLTAAGGLDSLQARCNKLAEVLKEYLTAEVGESEYDQQQAEEHPDYDEDEHNKAIVRLLNCRTQARALLAEIEGAG